MTEPKKLYRNTHDKMLAGVSSGLAEYFSIDPTLVRLGVVFTTLITGPVGLFGYFIAAIMIPEKPANEPPLGKK